MDDHYKTPLIQQAIEMAARNHRLAAGAIFHSDRGSRTHSLILSATLSSQVRALINFLRKVF